MNLLKKSIYALSLVGMAGLWSCSQDGMLPGDGDVTVKGQPVKLTLTVNRGDAQTRTILSEGEGGRLDSKWVANDILHVYDTNGLEVGTLTLKYGEDTSVGVFEGTITATDGKHDYSFWHYTLKEDQISIKNDNNSRRLAVNVSAQDFEDVEALSAMDILTSYDPNEMADAQVIVKDGKATVAKNVTLRSRLAMAHFSLSGLPKETAGTLKIYDTAGNIYIESGYMFSNTDSGEYLSDGEGSGISVNIAEGQTDVYVALIPNSVSYQTYTLGFELTDTANGKVYAYQFTSPTIVEAGVYYCGSDGKGQVIEMEDVTSGSGEVKPLPLDETELVGPVFEVNGRKFRFTKSNLKYNTENGAWGLIGEQYDFLCKTGWEHTDGSWGKTKETEIDQFGFGATGLYDAFKYVRAQSPAFWCETGNTGQASETKYPTPDIDVNSGMNGAYLANTLTEGGIQFKDYDWGKAYYLYKNKEKESTDLKPCTTYDWHRSSLEMEHALRYFTLSNSDWSAIIDYYYVIGATILDVPNPMLTSSTDKNKIYGLMILPIKGEGTTASLRTVSKRNKVTEFIKTVNVTSFKNADVSTTSSSSFKYESLTLTVEQFEELEQLGAVFLPEAGYRNAQSHTKDSAHYWTSTTGQTTNATYFDFDGNTTTKVFRFNSASRSLGCTIRLVREVPENYDSPVVVN